MAVVDLCSCSVDGCGEVYYSVCLYSGLAGVKSTGGAAEEARPKSLQRGADEESGGNWFHSLAAWGKNEWTITVVL